MDETDWDGGTIISWKGIRLVDYVTFATKYNGYKMTKKLVPTAILSAARVEIQSYFIGWYFYDVFLWLVYGFYSFEVAGSCFIGVSWRTVGSSSGWSSEWNCTRCFILECSESDKKVIGYLTNSSASEFLRCRGPNNFYFHRSYSRQIDTIL